MKKRDILTVCFGLPGSGKSSLASLLAKKAMKKGIPVYSNFPVIGAYSIDKFDLGAYEIKGGLILLDEAGICFNARDWKKFGQQHQHFFRYYRHDFNQVYVFSQSWDSVDKVIRDVAWRYLLVKRTLIPGLVKTRTCGMDPFGIDVNGQVTTKYFWLPGSTRFWFVRRAWKLFDSHSAPQLPKKVFSIYSNTHTLDEPSDGSSSPRLPVGDDGAPA